LEIYGREREIERPEEYINIYIIIYVYNVIINKNINNIYLAFFSDNLHPKTLAVLLLLGLTGCQDTDNLLFSEIVESLMLRGFAGCQAQQNRWNLRIYWAQGTFMPYVNITQ
jgi:hypothetical protein